MKLALALLLVLLCLYSSLSCEDYNCEFEENFADLQSGNTFYIKNKSNSKKKIVLIHGLLGDTTQFNEWKYIFSHSGYQVLVYDLLGHGQTEWKISGFFTQEKFVLQLNELLKSLEWVDKDDNVVNKFTLLGISMGGLISVKYALTYPKHLNALILMSPPGMMTKHDSPFLYRVSKSKIANIGKNIHKSKTMFRCILKCGTTTGIVKTDTPPKEMSKSVFDRRHRMFSTFVKSGGGGSMFDKHSYFEDLAKYEDDIKIVFHWGMQDNTVPFAPAVEFLTKHFVKTPIVTYPNMDHITGNYIVSPALISLDFMESNLTVGVPLGVVKGLDYFYDNVVNIITGINFTYNGTVVNIRYNPYNFTDDYLDFNAT